MNIPRPSLSWFNWFNRWRKRNTRSIQRFNRSTKHKVAEVKTRHWVRYTLANKAGIRANSRNMFRKTV